MAELIVPQNQTPAPEEPQDWESYFYQRACKQAQEECEAYLKRLDDKLFEEKPEGWRVVGKRRRTVVTRFGEVCIERRLYADEQGEGHFLLDERLGLKPQQVATPEVEEAVVELAAVVSFEQVVKQVRRLTAGVLSKSTVWRLLQAIGKQALEAEERLCEAVYEHGYELEPGKREVEWLYVEADGVWVRLQGEPNQKGMEIRLGIAYDGWEALRAEEERCQNKRVYVHGHKKASFWEGAVVAWYPIWAFEHLKGVVLNGDDARWIDGGKEAFAHVLRQQDGFHVARFCQRAFESAEGRAFYQALRQGKTDEVRRLWAIAQRKKGSSAQRALKWLETHLTDPEVVDWRIRAESAPPQAHGLGGMEGNIAHLIGRRMKGKGRSWSVQGALTMAKVQQFVSNREVSRWCRRTPPTPLPMLQPASRQPGCKQRHNTGDWLQARIPALHGRIPSDPTLLQLRHLLFSTN